jgi:hypothetical protein
MAGADKAARVSTRAIGFNRLGFQDPGRDVQGMDVLLSDHIAGKRCIQSPGPHQQFRVLRVPAEYRVGAVKRVAAMVGRLGQSQFANHPVMHMLDGSLVIRHGPGLKIDQEYLLAARGRFARTLDGKATRNIYCQGLRQINMLSGGDTGCRLLGMKVGRADDHHRVQVLFQQPEIPLEGGEPACFRHPQL